MDRRQFLVTGSTATGALILLGPGCVSSDKTDTGSAVNEKAPMGSIFEISLAQYSLHRAYRDGIRDPMNFAADARGEFGIGAIEYLSRDMRGREREPDYLAELKSRADGEGVRGLLIMVDGEGNLGSSDPGVRRSAVENHFKWVQAAKFLSCHSIRVNAMINAESLGYDEQMKLSADGLRQLVEFAAGQELNVIVENHGGLSSSGEWLSGVMEMVDHPRCGTLPDFGNFCIEGSAYPVDGCNVMYDYYRGVEELMPYAKAVSAKSYDFDEAGNETTLDYERLMRIVLDAGYRGYVGIEYEGSVLSEDDGIRATRDLLLNVRERLATEYKET